MKSKTVRNVLGTAGRVMLSGCYLSSFVSGTLYLFYTYLFNLMKFLFPVRHLRPREVKQLAPPHIASVSVSIQSEKQNY